MTIADPNAGQGLSGLSHDGGIPFERKQVTSLNMSTVQLVSPNSIRVCGRVRQTV